MNRFPDILSSFFAKRDRPRNSTPASLQPDAIVRNTPETLEETITRDMMPVRYRRAEGETE